MTTIYDVARKARVAAGTVSRAMSNKGYVAKETKRRIKRIAERLNYTPHLLAQSLKTKKTYALGLLIPDISNPIYPAITKGIYNTVKGQGYHLILGNSYGDPIEELNILRMLQASQIEGLILMASEVEEDRICNQYLSELATSGLPIILCGRRGNNLSIDRVDIDNVKGVYLGINHLIDLGHHSIALINGPEEVLVAKERQKGYKKALLEHHILVNKEIIQNTNFTQEGGYQATKKLLSNKKSITAIFAANDLMAIGAILAIEEKRLRIPEDMAIIGFDDINLASVIRPRLTTVAQPKEEAGRIIANLLLSRINKTAPEKPQNILLEPRLVIRESTIKMKAI